MNSFRKNLVKQAWTKLDKDGNGVLDINDIRGVYSAKQHPDVRSGKKTEDEILGEFLETFETHHNIANPNARDQTVTTEEFEEYYNNVSSSIDDDRYFELMMNNAWKLQEDSSPTRRPQDNRDFSYGSRRNYERSAVPFGTSEGPTDWSTSNRPSQSRGN